MKHVFSLIVAVFTLLTATAQDINLVQAQQIAKDFAATRVAVAQNGASQSNVTMAYSLASNVESGSTNLFVFNRGANGGFVIVSGRGDTDDEILGWCDHGSFDYFTAPPQIQALLKNYSRAIDSLRVNPNISAEHKVRKAAASSNAVVKVAPLLTTTWSQWWPYNMYCPEGCPTGCTITAAAQVMNYWKWPKTGYGSFTHEGLGVTVDFSKSTYDWDNMANDYSNKSSHSQEENAAVAKLMYDLGIAFGANYHPEGTSAGVMQYPFSDFFRYDPNMKVVTSTTNMASYIKSELDISRPVIYTAYREGGLGHALVCDGYDSEDYFHFNYGWGGSYDGFYKLGALHLYNDNMAVLGGIQPTGSDIVELDGMTYYILGNGDAELKNCSAESGDVTVPDYITVGGVKHPVTRINKGALTYNRQYGTLTIGNNVRNIAPSAFIACKINTLVVGDAVEEIGDQAFSASNIMNITLGKSVKRIGKNAFYACVASTVTCNSDAIEVDDNAFGATYLQDCEWFKNITRLGSGAMAMTRISNPVFEKLTYVGSRAFASTSISNATFPASLKYIAPDAFWGALVSNITIDQNNPWLKVYKRYITNKAQTRVLVALNSPQTDYAYGIPNTVIKLEPKSFGTGTKSVTIPSSVLEMEGAFSDCSRLSLVKCNAIVPPVITDATFNDAIFSSVNAKLYVPNGCETQYANAPGWRRFAGNIYGSLEYNPDDMPPVVYNMTVHRNDGQGISKDVKEIGSMSINSQKLVIDDWSTDVAMVDSITWNFDFVYDNAEVFVVNDTALTAKGENCTVKLDPTVINGETLLTINTSLNCPDKINGAKNSKVVEVSLGEGIHELTGTIEIRVPMELGEGEVACAAWYNPEAGGWEPVCGNYDTTTGELCILTDHLSTFGCFTVNNPFTAGAQINVSNDIQQFVLPELDMPISQIVENLKALADDPIPEVTGFDMYANQLGTVLSLGNDVIFNYANAAGFTNKFAEKISARIGYLGISLSIYQLLKASYYNQEEQIAGNSLKLILTGAQMLADKLVGTKILTASLATVAWLDYCINKFGETAWEIRKDQYQRGFDNYYATRGFRSTQDWYNRLYPICNRTDLTEQGLKDAITKEVHDYCWKFWNLPADEQVEFFEQEYKNGPVSGQGLNENIRQTLSGTLENELYSGILTSVFEAIKKHKQVEANKQAFSDFKDLCSNLNRWVTMTIHDSEFSGEASDNNKSEFAGYTARVAGIAEKTSVVVDPKAWECELDDSGKGKINFTAYGFINAEAKPEIQLFNEKNECVYRYPFEINERSYYGAPTALYADVDLRENGIEVPPQDEWHITINPAFSYFDDDGKPADMIDLESVYGVDTLGVFAGIKEALSKNRDINLDENGNFTIKTDDVTITGNIDPKKRAGTATFTLKATSEGTNPWTDEQYFDFWWSIVMRTYDVPDPVSIIKDFTANYQLTGDVTIGYSERADCYIFHFDGNGSFDFTGERWGKGLDVDYDWENGWFYTSKKMETKGIHVNDGKIKLSADLLY